MECFLQEATYDDCGQLLNILFTTEARNRILEATLKLVPGPTEAPTTDPVTINAYFPSNHPDGDYNMAQVRQQTSCRQIRLPPSPMRPCNQAPPPPIPPILQDCNCSLRQRWPRPDWTKRHRHRLHQVEKEMDRGQCKSTVNNKKHTMVPSEPTPARPEHPNTEETEEIDLKNDLKKMLEIFKEEMKNSLKELEEKSNKKWEAISKSLESQEKAIKYLRETAQDLKSDFSFAICIFCI
ncbi:uncharacterized protein LOC131901160 isoform X1 [Peromyscus eremicus]|uniref:uncharacterized protein LOC131901160 isoform X1 n=1 Tax=Peromyscus eremicus TaxID=42410 RepID=UPI0027DC4336|nr:uncharacterized protein LOC131901160 isoform X1 [Peromyscus eremicus]